MSMVSTSRTQRTDKSSGSTLKQSHATAEEIRLAQIIGSSGRDEDTEVVNNVAMIIEITGTTEDNARTALYDANNDTSRAIELILENGSVEQTNEWETAGRKKNKNAQSSVRGVDSFDEEIKEDTSPSGGSWERSGSKGRGRGRNTRSRGKSNDRDRRTEDDGRGGYESRERQRGGRRGRGRGGSGRGGRQPGRGTRRFPRFNQNRGEGGNEPSADAHNNFDEGFGNFGSNADPAQTDATKLWPGDDEDWGSLEVGTWSNEDAQKNPDTKNDANEPWGTGSWNDDLAESKVFQSQNAQISPSAISGALSQQNHIQQQQTGSAPQMGERIDLGALFKKNAGAITESGNTYPQQMNNNGLIGKSGMVFNNSATTQHTTPSVIQQLQQQGQSNSLFSELVNDMDSSRLIGVFERQGSSSSTNNSTAIGHYGSRGTESSYSQYNGKLVSESNDGNPSALLGSFAEQFKSSEQTATSDMLSQISDLTKSAFTSLKQTDSQRAASAGPDYVNFSQAQQREATEAVKASLGLPAINNEQLDSNVARSGPPGLPQTDGIGHATLSFGAPQPVRQTKQQRKKAPVTSKIPASAVEMPGAGGGGYHELSNFDLQFGMDDSTTTPATNEYGAKNGSISAPGTQNSLFNNTVMSSQASLINHIPSGNLEESSMFSTQLNSQSQQARAPQSDPTLQTNDTTTSAPMHTSQRYSETIKQNETLRGPPGIAHPQSLSSSVSSGNNLGALSRSAQQPNDLSSSGGSYGSGRMVTGGNMAMSGLSHETTIDQSANMGNTAHSYYTPSSLGQQTQQQMVSDLSSSAGRSLRSPVPTTSLPGSLQASPMSHITATPSKDGTGSASTAMSSLASGLAQSHITPHVGETPTKLQATSASAPINILGSSSSGTSLGSGGYGSMNIGYSAPSMQAPPSSTPVAASPGKHLASSDLYTSAGLSSSLHHNHQQPSSVAPSAGSLGSALGGSVLPMANAGSTKSTSLNNAASKAGPPNLTLGVPPLLPNQYGIPMGPGLMTAYTPEAALYGYTDPLMAVQSRVHQMPNYYDMYGASNPSANATSMNRDSSSNTATQGKFGRGEPSSPTSVIGMIGSAGSGIAQQQVATGQHSTQMKVSQTGQAQPFMNLPTAAPAAAYPGYSGLYYNAFPQYPAMFAAAAATAVPNAKHQVNATTAFQQQATGFANAYSTASISASSASNLHDLQGQGYNKNHMPAYEKQQAAFHHHTNTPPPAFNLQTLTAAMAAANSGAAAGGAPGMSPYTQAPFMTMLPTHQHSQIHLHLPQHGDAGQSVGSQRSQTSNPMGKQGTKAPFGNTAAPYWSN